MKKFLSILITVASMYPVIAQDKMTDRQVWMFYMDRIARPVLSNLANDQLKEKMPVELAKNIDNKENRSRVSYLEAFGRTLSGIAPWLNAEGGSKGETDLRNQYRQWTIKAIDNATDSTAKDYMVWKGGQPLVDASFVAFGLIRCPWLWEHLDEKVKQQVINCLRTTRSAVPVYSNWILFTAIIEAFFCKYGYEYDPVRIEYAVREFMQHWYIGDGLFADGMNFHFDYYNSIVIHPFLATVIDIAKSKTRSYNGFAARLDTINKRYAEIQERSIYTDGSYPIFGRSIVYRGGVFHHLSDISLRKKLPASLLPAQVRSALTAVIRKTLESTSTFTKDNWLTIGLFGSQPSLADVYITTGSLYICMDIFIALGLPDTDEFWSAPAQPWTSVKIWRGEDVPADHALDLR
jgi:hypothetical protein